MIPFTFATYDRLITDIVKVPTTTIGNLVYTIYWLIRASEDYGENNKNIRTSTNGYVVLNQRVKATIHLFLTINMIGVGADRWHRVAYKL